MFGGLSAAKLVTVFMSRTFNRRQGLIAGCVVAAVHLLFLLYLHFAYHSVYEDSADLLTRHSREVMMTFTPSVPQLKDIGTEQVIATLSRVKRNINGTMAGAMAGATSIAM